MNTDKLDAYEQEIEDKVDVSQLRDLTPAEQAEWREAARNTLRKSQRINIRLSEIDLAGVRRVAAEQGLPYQTLISSLIHRFVQGGLVEAPRDVPADADSRGTSDGTKQARHHLRTLRRTISKGLPSKVRIAKKRNPIKVKKQVA